MKLHRLLPIALAVSLVVPAALARGKKDAPTAPGTYKEWGPDIDEIEIMKTFKIGDYDRVVVLPFDTSKAPLPDQKEKWYGTMKSALASYNVWFVEALQKELKSKVKVEEASTAPKAAKTLIIRGTVDSMDPGSRAGRYFAGFGAGSASAKSTIEIVDAKSGSVLARITQARRSGGTWKGGGGSDLDVMRDSVHATGEDIARALDTFM
jgi:hypothetical protein